MKLAEVIQQTLDQFAVRARDENILVHFQVNPDVPEILVDPQTVVHDVSYLMEHLLSFMPENESINVDLSKQGQGRIILSIANTGINLVQFTGVIKHCFLETTLYENAPNATRYELELETNLNGAQSSTVNNKLRSENNFYLEIQQRLRSHFNTEDSLLKGVQSNPLETAFLTRVNRIVMDNISVAQFDVNRLAELMNMSRTQLFRKLKPIIRQSASGYIRSFRLQKAKELLETTELRVSEVAFITGFETPSHFTKVFVKKFGMKPSAIARNRSPETNGAENAT